jgi:MFS family permease
MFDFIARHSRRRAHAAGFGMVQVFRALGLFLAPLILGFVAADALGWLPLKLYWIYLAGGLVCFWLVLAAVPRRTGDDHQAPHRKRFGAEVRIWRKLALVFSPVFLLTIFLFIIDAFFWTLGPLYGESPHMTHLGGFFLAAYTLPAFVVGWIVGPLTARFGKHRTAYWCLCIGSLLLSMFFVVPQGVAVLALVAGASFFVGLALPSVNAIYAEYISKRPNEEGEIESMEDFSANISYVIGPILAGYLADQAGIPVAFSLIGAAGVILALVLLARKSSNIPIRA